MRTLACVILAFVIAAAPETGNAQTPAMGANAQELFERGMNALQGGSATRSVTNAIDYLRRSADLGYGPAQVALGYLYETGRGVTADPGHALDWYTKAARQGDPLAQWLAGRVIFFGGVPPRDLNQAANWFEQASAQDNPFANYLLGRVALERSDYAIAVERFRTASEQGLPQAQFRLATLLRDGRGVAVDRFEAYVWMLVSADNGFRVTQTDLQSLESELGTSQIEQAKTRARDLESRVTRSVVAHGCTGWHGEFDDVPSPPPPDLQRFCR